MFSRHGPRPVPRSKVCCGSMAGLSFVRNCRRNFHPWPPEPPSQFGFNPLSSLRKDFIAANAQIDPAADHLAIVALAICYHPQLPLVTFEQIYSAGYPGSNGVPTTKADHCTGGAWLAWLACFPTSARDY